MKVLVIGAGGREHALAWRLSRSPRVKSIVSCPGNAGLTQLGPCWSGVSPDADPAQLLQGVRDREAKRRRDRIKKRRQRELPVEKDW